MTHLLCIHKYTKDIIYTILFAHIKILKYTKVFLKNIQSIRM